MLARFHLPRPKNRGRVSQPGMDKAHVLPSTCTGDCCLLHGFSVAAVWLQANAWPGFALSTGTATFRTVRLPSRVAAGGGGFSTWTELPAMHYPFFTPVPRQSPSFPVVLPPEVRHD